MADEKLSLAEVLHRILDALGLHPDTASNLHTLVSDHVATDEERDQAARSPWADKPDQEVVEAAIAGDQAAAAEYRSRKDAQAAAASAPPPAPGA